VIHLTDFTREDTMTDQGRNEGHRTAGPTGCGFRIRLRLVGGRAARTLTCGYAEADHAELDHQFQLALVETAAREEGQR
jgi:hypothetical protein